MISYSEIQYLPVYNGCKNKKIPGCGTHCDSKLLEDVHNRMVHQQSCRFPSQSFESYRGISRNKYHWNIYDKKYSTCSIFYYFMSKKILNWYLTTFTAFFKKNYKWWFWSSIQNLLFCQAVKWNLCLLIPILSHQTEPPAAYCLQHDSFPGEPRCVFLLLRIRQVEFFWNMLSLT